VSRAAVESGTGPAEMVSVVQLFPDRQRIFSYELISRIALASKDPRLRNVLGTIPAHVTLIPIDFDRDGLGTVQGLN
jgi:hypothetical protein